MLPLSRMMLAMILTVVVQFVNGHQNTVHVSKFISEESFIAGTKCCAYGNCSCNSLDDALANLISNTLINITTDVTLSSLVTASDIENVSIIGHNSPTVNCKGIGRIHMNFCKNCTIQDITWDECGTKNIDNHIEPGVMLSYSSTVTIQNCSFQRSVGQAVVLSKISGDININDCKFVNNSYYGGHGAAIYYLSNNSGNPQFVFIISNCNFSYNRMKSLVYLENTSVKYNKIILTNSIFHNNQGISIYAIHHTIYLNGEVLFYNNIAENGAGIFIRDYSTIMFNSNVTFIQNTAINSGGAVFLGNHSVCLFDHNSVAIFYNNKATNGTIYTDVNCNVTFKATCKVTFSGNSVTQYGAAIYSVNDSHVTFTGNAKVTFSDNIVNPIASNDISTFIRIGGIIYSHINCSISFEGNSHTIFSYNIAYTGGAIFSNDNSNISFKGNSYAAFSHNTAYSVGGAIYSFNSSISFKENSNIEFSNNYAPYGGAITTKLSDSTFEGSSTTVFSNNVARYSGGAIGSHDCNVMSFKGNSTTLFDSNTVAINGAAISIECRNLCFKENATTVFSNNTASKGGAIYSEKYNHMYCRGNAITVFSNNTANSGGAIYSYDKSYTSFLDNSTALFTNNTANSGGAIYSYYKSYTSFLDNSTTLFSNNSAAEYGGAITLYLQCVITFSDNSTVTFNNNNATFGATVFANSNSTIISKDDTNLFFNNLPARWCHNKCLAYTGQGDVVTVDDTGLVWCSNQNLLRCLSSWCYCKSLENILRTGINYNLVNISDNVVVLSSAFKLPHTDISIIGHNNPTVICVNGGRLIFNFNYIYKINIQYNLTIEGITWIACGEVTDILVATDSSVVGDAGGVLAIFAFNKVTIQKCSFQYSVGQVVSLMDVDDVDITDCNFVRNTNDYRGYGAVIYYIRTVAYSILPVSFKHCYFGSNDGIKSVIYFNKLYHLIYDYTYDMQIYLINSSFHNNQGVSIYLSIQQSLSISGEVSFENNVADYGAGIYLNDGSTVTFGKNSNTKFINNSVHYNGAAIFLNEYSRILFDNNSTVTFTGNRATSGTIYSKANSNMTFKATSEVIFSNNSVTKYGTAIYASDTSNVTFAGNAIFDNNVIPSSDMHLQLGGTVFTENNSHIFFEENSITRFSNNFADFGAAIFSIYYSHIIFKDMSTIMFNDNTAHYCGALTFAVFSTVMFTDHTKVTYNANTVSRMLPSNYESSAGAICTYQNCKITFSEHSSVTFTSNSASRGGAVTILEGNVFIEEYSIVSFYNNFAWYSSGGSLVCSNNSNVIIGGNSNVSFNGNKASESGGAVHSYNMCKITFKDNSTSNFIDNSARNNGGAILSSEYSEISFEGNSTVIFHDNVADKGGALHFDNASNILFSKLANVEFHNNKASYGAAILANDHCNISLTGNSDLLLTHNEATQSGGAGYFNYSCNFISQENAVVTFDNNRALHGGAVHSYNMCKITFKDNSTSNFIDNNARNNGGAILSSEYSEISFEGNSTVTFYDNVADNGGALHFKNALFSEFASVEFHYNKASYGAGILANDYCNISLTGNSNLSFAHNEATQSGGAGYFNYSCNFISQENAVVTFDNNRALHGGAICIKNNTELLFRGNSTAYFCNNLATTGGGAVKVSNDSSIVLRDHTTIKFIDNNAQYGAAIFLDTTALMINSSDETCLNFTNNVAKVLGSSMYQDITGLCNGNCIINRTMGINNEYIATPPNKLQLDHPAICVDEDNDTQCTSYYVQNIMLGTDVAIPACVLDYYNHPINSTQFFVHSEVHPNYFNTGPKEVLIFCDKFEEINIIGNQALSKSINFSINISLNIVLNANWKEILVNLIIELSPCHLGFWQYNNSVRCECYSANDIVFCSGNSSTIKRNYWFGNVTGKPTVTFCPINYCNFSCCETSNGYYHLSPVRDNQCRSHRSGPACGNCEEGYTLSFDSPECVDVKECGIGQTILVLVLILLYWVIIIAAVFAMMHFKVGIGYLYAITYYYSVVDLLSQSWYPSNLLYIIINVMSSIAKIIPQFLGQICFIKNMSGIDQQFIHYMHPVAISLFLVMITLLARRSRRLSTFMGKGIIHVICCLLLLSYTSLASTSLLLMRPLLFNDVDKVYTYVSPDIEYFHGRHLVYAIVAMLFTIVIVIGLPLLLALEPFLNSKINFVKIKPLLDQFQGCYKDKYRYFAAYYMICRLLIITIIIANSSNGFIFHYLLIAASVIVDLVHQCFRPYSSLLLNVFDGVILHFLVLVSVLPLVESFDSFNSNLLVVITLVLIILPALIFVTMSVMINKEEIRKLPGYCYTKWSQLRLRHYSEIPLTETEQLSESDEDEYINDIDDSMRTNATIFDV